jgi:hypothetical protein
VFLTLTGHVAEDKTNTKQTAKETVQ